KKYFSINWTFFNMVTALQDRAKSSVVIQCIEEESQVVADENFLTKNAEDGRTKRIKNPWPTTMHCQCGQKCLGKNTNTQHRPFTQPIKILDLDDDSVATTTQPYVDNEKQTFKIDSIPIKDTASLSAIGGTLQTHEHSNAEKTIPAKMDIIQLHPILGTNKAHVIEITPPEPPLIQSPNQPVQPPEHIVSTEITILIPAVIPPNQIHSICENANVPVLPKHHEPVRRFTEKIIAYPLTDSQWLQCQTPIKKGGLGLNSANAHSSAAFITSALTAEQQLPLVHPHIRCVDWSSQEEFEDAITHYNKNTKPQDNITDWLFAPSQASLSKKVNTKIQNEIQNQRSDDQRILIKAISKPHASNYLIRFPISSDGRFLTTGKFTRFCDSAWGANKRLSPNASPTPCVPRQWTVSETMHYPVNFAKDEFLVMMESWLAFPTFSSELISHMTRQFGPMIYRTTGQEISALTHHLSKSQTIIKNEKCALENYYSAKTRKHRLRCEQANKSYTPLIAETTGGWHPETRSFFDRLAQVITEKEDADLDKTKMQ
ncbi:hypothetical protein RFI_21944, partial [Reticulomyxa filosa]